MWKEKLENIKTLILKKKEENGKKNIENMVVFLIILIVTIIAINTIWNDGKEEPVQSENISNKTMTVEEEEKTSIEKDELETKLESILSKIEGAGMVSVLITHSQSSEVVAMYNENQKDSTTEETDTNGGTRKITQADYSKEIIYKEENGEKIPVTQKLISPKIEGAIIAAEGARNSEVKTNIIQAVEAATGLPTHKIQVFATQ